jgi:PTS system mannose-specific IIB component/fructoselysine and glucoselysine-specific PTS system IIB component
MPISLIRVDERLIHGQVVVGWGGQIRPERYVVVDALVASSAWEQELYVLGVPEGVEVLFLGPEEAAHQLENWRTSQTKTVVLTRDIETMLEVAKHGGLEGEEVNLGGLHAKKGRTEVLAYLYLDDDDLDGLKALEAAGAIVSAQDLPGSPKVGLAALGA